LDLCFQGLPHPSECHTIVPCLADDLAAALQHVLRSMLDSVLAHWATVLTMVGEIKAPVYPQAVLLDFLVLLGIDRPLPSWRYVLHVQSTPYANLNNVSFMLIITSVAMGVLTSVLGGHRRGM
jgi:hypothetical protein